MEESLSAGCIGAVLGNQGQERVADFLGPAGYLGDKCSADPSTTIGIGDGHGQDECLLARMGFPAFVVPEVAVEPELGDPDDGSVDLGHDDVQALGVVEPVAPQIVRVQQLRHHRVVGLGDVTDERHAPSIPDGSTNAVAPRIRRGTWRCCSRRSGRGRRAAVLLVAGRGGVLQAVQSGRRAPEAFGQVGVGAAQPPQIGVGGAQRGGQETGPAAFEA